MYDRHVLKEPHGNNIKKHQGYQKWPTSGFRRHSSYLICNGHVWISKRSLEWFYPRHPAVRNMLMDANEAIMPAPKGMKKSHLSRWHANNSVLPPCKAMRGEVQVFYILFIGFWYTRLTLLPTFSQIAPSKIRNEQLVPIFSGRRVQFFHEHQGVQTSEIDGVTDLDNWFLVQDVWPTQINVKPLLNLIYTY